MKVTTKQGKIVDLFKAGSCLACDLGIPHNVKQNQWCKVKEHKPHTKEVNDEVRNIRWYRNKTTS